MDSEIICDVCGKSCAKHSFIVDNPHRADHGKTAYCNEYAHINAYWGYHSGKDTEVWEANICEECVTNKLGFVNFTKKHYI